MSKVVMYKVINRKTGYGFIDTWKKVMKLDARLYDVSLYEESSKKWKRFSNGIEVKDYKKGDNLW